MNVNHSGLRGVIPMETIWLQPKYGIKKITGPRINKELSAGLNGSVSVSGHCHDRRVKGFDSPFSS